MTRLISLFSVVVILSCGGSQQPADDGLGQSTAGEKGSGPAADLDSADGAVTVVPDAAADAGIAEERPPYTIVLKNTGEQDLVFNMDAGWAANIIVFSGKPPKAKVILPFAKHCTAACELAPEERCPYCPQPEKLKDIREAQKLETVLPGALFEVPWDGQIHIYEKTRGTQNGKKKRCECYEREPAPEATYTVRACGLRLTKTARQRTKIQCVDSEMTVSAEGPQRLEIEFPNPPLPTKKRRRR